MITIFGKSIVCKILYQRIVSEKKIDFIRNGASSVILAKQNSSKFPTFDGLEKAARIPNSDFRLFGKPSSRPYRRMGVALSYGSDPVKKLIAQSKKVSNTIIVNE